MSKHATVTRGANQAPTKTKNTNNSVIMLNFLCVYTHCLIPIQRYDYNLNIQWFNS